MTATQRDQLILESLTEILKAVVAKHHPFSPKRKTIIQLVDRLESAINETEEEASHT